MSDPYVSVSDMLSGASLHRASGEGFDLFAANNNHNTTAYAGAGFNRQFADWPAIPHDPNDVFWTENRFIADRSEDLLRNNPHAVAIAETIIMGTLGPSALPFKSLYQADPMGVETTDQDQKIRRIIETEIRGACCSTSLDAAGQLTERDMLVVLIASMIARGDGFSFKCWKPNRPGIHTHATTWRQVHAARVCNPGFVGNIVRPDGSRLYEGFEISKDGDVIAIHVLVAHPFSQLDPRRDWMRIPIWGNDGTRNVVHLKATRFPDQTRGIGWLAPIMLILQHLGKTDEAYVLAKRVQSCTVYLVEVDDPAKAAAKDGNGAMFNANTKIVPGKIYYVKTGTSVQFLSGSYQGQDYQQFSEVLLTNMCAALNLPMAYVLNRLTDGSLASARAALMQAWATFTTIQEMVINYVKEPWTQSIISESFVRGRIPVPEANLRLCFRGRYGRPPRGFPDPVRETAAAQAKMAMGVSPTTVYADMGLVYEDEMRQHKKDKELAASEGITLPNEPPKPVDPSLLEDETAPPAKPGNGAPPGSPPPGTAPTATPRVPQKPTTTPPKPTDASSGEQGEEAA